MRFKDLSAERTIIDEAPVGMMQRMGNWAMSKTGYGLKDKGQANQLKATEANRLWGALKQTLGTEDVPIEKVQDFFIRMGYGRSGKEILKKIAQEKRGSEPAPEATPAEEPVADTGLDSPKPSKKQQVLHMPTESIIHEAQQPIVLNKKELEAVIRQVVWRAAETRPDLFTREALRKQGKKGSEFGGEGGNTEDRGDSYDDEDSEPTVDYDPARDEQVDVNKDELLARFEKLKAALNSRDESATSKAYYDLEDFIDNL
jgi:hypothetical protein